MDTRMVINDDRESRSAACLRAAMFEEDRPLLQTSSTRDNLKSISRAMMGDGNKKTDG